MSSMGSSRPPLAVLGALAGAIALWASAFAAIRVALPSLGYASLVSGRLLIAAAAFAVLAAVRGIRRPRAAEVAPICAMGATGVAGYQLLISAGEETVPAGTAALLFAAAPVVAVVLAGLVLRERLGVASWCGLAVALGGAGLVAAGQGAAPGAGLGGMALVTAAAACYAVWIVVQKRALTRMSPFHATVWSTWFGAVLALPFAGGLPDAVASASTDALLSLLFLGIGISIVPFLLWGWVLARTAASVAAPALLLVGPAGVVVAWLLLGEAPTLLTLTGGAVTLAGVAAVVLRHRPPVAARVAASSPSSIVATV